MTTKKRCRSDEIAVQTSAIKLTHCQRGDLIWCAKYRDISVATGQVRTPDENPGFGSLDRFHRMHRDELTCFVQPDLSVFQLPKSLHASWLQLTTPTGHCSGIPPDSRTSVRTILFSPHPEGDSVPVAERAAVRLRRGRGERARASLPERVADVARLFPASLRLPETPGLTGNPVCVVGAWERGCGAFLLFVSQTPIFRHVGTFGPTSVWDGMKLLLACETDRVEQSHSGLKWPDASGLMPCH